MKAKKEKPRPAGWRMYNKQRDLVRKMAKKTGDSEAQIVRDAIEAFVISK